MKELINNINNIDIKNIISQLTWTQMAAVIIAMYLIQTVAYCGIFKKAGEKTWKAYIPVINVRTQYKISWSVFAFWLLLLLVAIKISMRYVLSLIPEFQYCDIANIAIYVLLGLVHIISCYKLSKSFGRKIIYCIELILFPQIFMLGLAVGNSEYIGKKGGKKDGRP